MKPIFHLCVFVVASLFVVACDSSSSGSSKRGGADNIPTPSEVSFAITEEELDTIRSANGRPVEEVILGLTTIVEARVSRGEMLSAKAIQTELDRVLMIHCDGICEIRRKGE